ncbi:DNA methyltransferase [Mycobacterium phage Che9d]|uniref:Cytosine-specific methyltransferase n=1 Tax=Mycobacterium phage Che9d TaxID=2907834 RepID=Q855N3_9CAUD|nr:DNA methyltransferase [Mycobacterium phage Che9d]AAN07998.1 DNA methylase [Mycobacterium phage Che9d]
MNVLSLFSGIGGLELGLERAGMTVVGQVEINPYCRQILAKHWPHVPRHDDVRTTVEWWESEERPRVDLICGGFPCQDISNAGARKGITGPKSSLWGGMLHTVRNIRPRYVLIENVAALLVRGVDTVLADLHESGFNAEWSVLSACAMGAPHTRERLFILAYPNNQRLQASGKSRVRDDFEMAFRGVGTEHVHAVAQPDSSQRGAHWASEPGVDRMADGISAELDRRRLFALGNAVVPQISEHIGRMILEATA